LRFLSPGSKENITLSRRPSRVGIHARRIPSRVKPARSATRWEARFSGTVIRFSRFIPKLIEGPARYQPYRDRRRAMPACLTAQPVTDRGQPDIIGRQVQPDRSQAIAACRVRDYECRVASPGPAAASVLDECAGIRLRIRVRDPRDIPAQLAVAARRDNPRNVAGHRSAKDDPLGGQRRVGEGEWHTQQNIWANCTFEVEIWVAVHRGAASFTTDPLEMLVQFEPIGRPRTRFVHEIVHGMRRDRLRRRRRRGLGRIPRR